MNDPADELAFWLAFRSDVAEKLELLEAELTLASPHSHNDDGHQFLIKKVRSFRDILIEVDQRISHLS